MTNAPFTQLERDDAIIWGVTKRNIEDASTEGILHALRECVTKGYVTIAANLMQELARRTEENSALLNGKGEGPNTPATSRRL